MSAAKDLRLLFCDLVMHSLRGATSTTRICIAHVGGHFLSANMESTGPQGSSSVSLNTSAPHVQSEHA